jgi:hypothetical protein
MNHGNINDSIKIKPQNKSVKLLLFMGYLEFMRGAIDERRRLERIDATDCNIYYRAPISGKNIVKFCHQGP